MGDLRSRSRLTTETGAFYQLSTFKLSPTVSSFPFPVHVLVSENHSHSLFSAATDRRLRNVYAMLAWQVPAGATGEAVQDADVAAVDTLDERFVILTLEEIESLRRAIHTNHSAFQGGDAPQAVLRFMDGDALDTAAPSTPAVGGEHPDAIDGAWGVLTAGPDAPVSIALQCARFFNCDQWFTHDQKVALLYGLAQASIVERQEYYNASAAGRRRFRSFSESLAVVFKQADAALLLKLQALAGRVRDELMALHGSLQKAFAALSASKENWLSRGEFRAGLSALPSGVTDAEFTLLWDAADTDGNNWLSLAEFVTRLSSLDFTRTMMATEQDSLAAAAVADVSLDKFIASLADALPSDGEGAGSATAVHQPLDLFTDMHMPQVYVSVSGCSGGCADQGLFCCLAL